MPRGSPNSKSLEGGEHEDYVADDGDGDDEDPLEAGGGKGVV